MSNLPYKHLHTHIIHIFYAASTQKEKLIGYKGFFFRTNSIIIIKDSLKPIISHEVQFVENFRVAKKKDGSL